MVSISQFLNNIKTLVGKYHYTKTQSDLKYIGIDDLNDAILAEITPAPSNPSVTVNVTNLSNSEEDIFAFLTDDVYSLNDPQTLTNGVVTFDNVASGTYYVVLAVDSDYPSPIGAKEVTVSDSNMTVSFTVRDVDIYEYSDETGSENATGGGNGFSILDSNTNCEISTDESSVLLADGEYMSNGYDFYDGGASGMYVTIGPDNSRITFYVPASQQDPMEP